MTVAQKSPLTLIIAEKPSVAADLVKALGAKKFKKEKTHYASDSTIVSWALGHLVRLADPKEIDDCYKNWNDIDLLPILPSQFKICPIQETKSQLNALGKLIRKKEVGVIINACDAGREGELIFHYIIEHEKGKTGLKNKVLKRLWMQSMTTSAIQEAFENLRSNEEMLNLQEAAISRSEADWLVGINGSRALTAYKNTAGSFRLTPCGRVQTPTLAMIVQREKERLAFEPKTFWTIQGIFQNNKENYPGKWFLNKGKETSKQIFNQEEALAILKKCEGKEGSVSETTKPSTQKCGPLYDLTSLQREANNRFGFSAKTTLQIAQALYEKHKLTTYPRTDSKFLPEDYVSTVKKTLGMLKGSLEPFAEQVLKNNWVKKNPKIFNNKKISDHHAIIPTGNAPKSLTEAEQKIYNMICQRFIAVFFPPAQYLNTERITTIEGETFLTEGKILVDPGFLAVYGKEAKQEGDLPKLANNKAKNIELESIEDTTKPPARYTESSLLSMMEGAGKLIEDDELRDAIKDRGLGTPATRAATIEKLISDKYVVRDAKELIPTAKAFDLIQLLNAMDIESLTSPELTGEWEHQLGMVEQGALSRDVFMQGITELTSQIVKNIKDYEEDNDKKEASFSPVNGIKVFETVSKYTTEDGISINKMLGGRLMSPAEIKELLKEGKLPPLTGFRSKKGVEFAAAVIINDKKRAELIFETPNTEHNGIVLGYAPQDKSPVYETLTAYVSQSSIDGDSSAFRLNKIILGKEISVENLQRLLRGEKTELIQGFRSARTKKLFDAYLFLDEKGAMKFEFPPRPASKRFFKRATKKATKE
ncbi:MAG: DNA topoisomerase III [Fibrobacteraceae bacterium]|nr:DNA topoisomerase III [Fibrobacteraceae bacterium]